MRVVKALLTLVLVLGLAAGAAYGAGVVMRHHDQRTVAGSDHPLSGPASDPSSSAPRTTPTPTPSTTPSSTPSPTPSDDPVADVLQPGAKGTEVRELQVRLHQLAWLPETTTGTYDDATVAAVKGFQAKRGLDRTGVLDRRTWHRLVAMTDRPSHDAMFNVLHAGKTLVGPGDTGSDVRDLQARLKQLAWYFGDVTGTYDDATVTAVKGFQGQAGHPGHRRGRPADPRPARPR